MGSALKCFILDGVVGARKSGWLAQKEIRFYYEKGVERNYISKIFMLREKQEKTNAKQIKTVFEPSNNVFKYFKKFVYKITDARVCFALTFLRLKDKRLKLVL